MGRNNNKRDKVHRQAQKQSHRLRRLEHLFNLGLYYLEHERDNRKTEAVYREYLLADADDYCALNNLGAALMRQQRFDEALPIFRRAVELSQELNATVLMNLGRSYSQTKRFFVAEIALQKAHALAPDCWLVLLSLAELYLASDRLELAAEYLSKVLEVAPNEATVYAVMASIAGERHDLEVAAGCLERAIELESDPHRKQDYRRSLLQSRQQILNSGLLDERHFFAVAERVCGNRAYANALYHANRDKFELVVTGDDCGHFALADGVFDSDLILPSSKEEAAALLSLERAFCEDYCQGYSLADDC